MLQTILLYKGKSNWIQNKSETPRLVGFLKTFCDYLKLFQLQIKQGFSALNDGLIKFKLQSC